jgi:hypothetical protein
MALPEWEMDRGRSAENDHLQSRDQDIVAPNIVAMTAAEIPRMSDPTDDWMARSIRPRALWQSWRGRRERGIHQSRESIPMLRECGASGVFRQPSDRNFTLQGNDLAPNTTMHTWSAMGTVSRAFS